jgi:hypothetical protein
MLSTKELAERWKMTPDALKQMRYLRQGPVFVRIGTRVLYRLEDVEAYEKANRVPTREVAA